jgi:hypothetical protein
VAQRHDWSAADNAVDMMNKVIRAAGIKAE